jgi:hypothetical protein
MAVSQSNKNGLAGVVLIAAFVLGAWPVQSHATSASERENPVTVVHDFLRVAYPELFGKDRFMKISIGQAIDSSWRQLYKIRFEITPFRPEVANNPPMIDQHTGKPVPPPSNVALMNGLVWFDDEGHIFKMWADGSDILHSAQNRDIEQLIEWHPEWSDARTYEELKKAGALYGPAEKEPFLRSVHLDPFEKFLGHLKIKSVEFNGPLDEHVGSYAGMFWGIDADAQLSDGTRHTYGLIFEPFGGRLEQIERVDPPPHQGSEPR